MKHADTIIDATELLNELNEAIARKPRTLDCVVTASSMLLASALRQIGGGHGLDRARSIAASLVAMVQDINSEPLKQFFDGDTIGGKA